MNQVQRPWQEIEKNHLFCVNHIFNMLIGTPFICHQEGPLADVGMPPTQEKVVTYLLKPLDLAI